MGRSVSPPATLQRSVEALREDLTSGLSGLRRDFEGALGTKATADEFLSLSTRLDALGGPPARAVTAAADGRPPMASPKERKARAPCRVHSMSQSCGRLPALGR